MKELSVTEVFCEVFSGLLVIICALPWLADAPISSLVDFYRSAYLLATPSTLTAVLVSSYLLGLLVDGVGLVADSLVFDRFLGSQTPTAAERTKFYKTAPEHLLSYRDTQWAYYSLYRNLFVISAFGSVSTVFLMINLGHWLGAFVFLVLVLLMEYGLFLAMKTLVQLYYGITRTFGE